MSFWKSSNDIIIHVIYQNRASLNNPIPFYWIFKNDLVQAAVSEYHRPGGLNSKYLYFAVQEAGQSKIKVPAYSVSVESPLFGLQMVTFLLHPYLAERKIISFMSIIIRMLIPFMRIPPSWPNFYAKAPPPDTIAVGIRGSICGFAGTREHKHSVYSIKQLLSYGENHPLTCFLLSQLET